MGIELRGRDLTLDAGKRVELSYVAINASGQSRGETDFFALKLPPETRAHVEQTGIRVLRRFDLPAGRYQLRVAAHDIAGERVGSVNYDLEVPDYSKLPLGMSGVLLTSRAGTNTLRRGLTKFCSVRCRLHRSRCGSFPQDDEVLVFAEIYERNTGAPHVVDIATTVTSTDGKVVWKDSDERSSSELQGSNGGYGHTVRVPMSGLSPDTTR